MKYLHSIGLKSLLLLVLIAISSVVFAQTTELQKPANVPGQSANALDQTPSTPANGPQTDFEPNNRMQDATPLSTRAAQAHKISWDLDRDWLAVEVPFSTLGVVRLAAQVPGQASVVLQARVWRQRADGSAEDIGLRRFDRQHIELALEPFNGRVGTQGRARKYWLQIEKAQGAANRVGFTANNKLLHRGSVLPSRNAEASALARSIDIYVDEPDNNRNEAKEIAESTSHARWLHWDLDGTGENYIWDQDVVTFVLPPYSQATLSMDTPGNSGAVFLELEEDDPAGLGGSSVNGWTAITGSSPRRFFAKATRNYGVPSVDHIAYTLSMSAISAAGVDPDAYERAGEAIDNAHTDYSDAYTVQRNLHTTSDQDWIKGLKSASVPGSRGTISLTSNFPDLGLESQFYVELWIQHPGQARVRTYAGSLPLSMPVPFSTSNEGSNYWIHVRAATGSTLTPAQSPYKITYRLYTPPTNVRDEYEVDDSEPGNSVSFDQNGNANPRYHTLWKDGASGNSTSPDVDWISYTIPANKRASILVNPVIGRYFQAGNMWSIFVKNENTGVVIVPERFFDEPLDLPVQSSLTEPRTFLIRVRAKPNSNLRELAGDYVLDFPYRTATLALSVNPASVAPGASATMSAVPTVPDGSVATATAHQYKISGSGLEAELSNCAGLASCVFSAINPQTGANLAPGSYSLDVRANVAWDNTSASVQSARIPFVVTGSGAPTISVNLNPIVGAPFTAPATINLSAGASVSTGSIQRVEFYRGTTIIGTDNQAPYTAMDSGVAAGNYSYTAKAFDNANPQNFAVSAPPVAVLVGEGAPDRLDDPAYSTLLPYQPQPQSTYAGTGSGSGGTSGGQASYSIPVQIAPGRHGMQPSVSLNYSSSAGNGIAGMGWNLSASASIHRCPQTRAQDGQSNAVTFTMEDRLCLDGQRLIPVQSNPVYGSANLEYRTEQDSQTKVLQLGGDLTAAATYFVVYRSNGMVEHFGAAKNPSGVLVADAAAQQFQTGNTKPLAWMLRRSLDRSGNAVLYSYQNYGSAELLLKQIEYTGTEQMAGDRSVNFDYTVRPDLSSSGLGGFLTRQTQVLNLIESKVGTQLVRRYKLQYGPTAGVIGVSKSSARAQLTQVTECANESGAEKCFAPIALTWQDTPTTAPNLTTGTIVWPARMPVPLDVENSADYDVVKPIGDIDGDGVVELQRTMRSGPSQVTSYVVAFNADRTARGYTLGGVGDFSASDVNNDGRSELWSVTPGSGSGNLSFRFWNAGTGASWISSNFVPANVALCALATASGPLGTEYFKPRLIDFNGDGFLDVMAVNRGACGQPGYGIHVHLNTTTNSGVQSNFAPTFAANSIFQALTDSQFINEGVAHVGDLDGNGLPEIVTSTLNSGAIGQHFSRIYRPQLSGGTLSFSSVLMSSIGADPVYARHHYYMDVNGDGLDDLVIATSFERSNVLSTPCDSVWALHLNLGTQFAHAIALGGASRAGLELSRERGGFCDALSRDWHSYQAGLMTPEDIDADGRSELLIPRSLAQPSCTRAIWIDPKKIQNFITACTPEPRGRSTVTFPNTGSISLADSAQITLLTPPFGNPSEPGSIEDYSILDSAAYKMSQLRFIANIDGSYSLQEVPLADSFTRQTGNSENADFDLFGDGLVDRASHAGCKVKWIGDPNTACTDTSSPTQVVTRLFNNGAGQRTNRAALTPELLKSVSDAYGKQVEWTYDALSSSGNRTSGLPLYALPARDGIGIDAPYIDAKHFYFASSMQVVAEMFTRNGLGAGMNETRYGYEEAMYNHQGRGFQGFRKIVAEDRTIDSASATGALNGLRSTTIFHQKFPLTGMVECEASTLVNEAFANCAQLTASNNPISGSKSSYSCKVAGGAASASSCDAWAAGPAASYGFVFPASSDSYQNNLAPAGSPRTAMRSSASSVNSVDSFGNVLSETATNTSTYANGQTETRITRVMREYAPADTTNWWVNKLLKQTSTADAITGSRALPLGAQNPARISSAVYGYSADRQVNCQAMIPGGYVPAVNDSSCNSSTFTPGNADAAADGVVESRSKTSFDGFGNASSVITEARNQNSRTVSSIYDPALQGYFPTQVSDAFGATSTSVFNPRFGKPIQITDANGLVSSSTLDGLGREIGMTAPSKVISGVVNQMAPDKLMAYERCTAALCPIGTVLRVVSDQIGSPRQIMFMDSLGRTLRSAKAAFNQTDATGNVLNWDIVDSAYSNRGLMAASGTPRRVTNSALASASLLSSTFQTRLTHDALGRMVSKTEERSSRQNNGVVSYAQVVVYRSEYVHTGFKTAIRVCAVNQLSFACPATGTSLGDHVLNLAREFDESGAVIQTTDANTNNTTFYYDAARSPVRLVDAESNLTTAVYNNAGHRTQVTDPNRGTWEYQYNGFGELKYQLDARRLELNQSFDVLGRLTTRSWNQPARTNAANSTAFSDNFVYNNAPTSGQYGTLISSSRSGEGTISESYQYDALNRPLRKTYAGAGVAGQSWSLFEASQYDPNFGRPVRKTYPAVSGADAKSIYLGYTLGGDAMQSGYAADYLATDPRSDDPARFLRRDSASNARGQMLTSRFGSGDGSQAYQWLVSEYDSSTGWLLSRCSGLVTCSGVSQLSQTNVDAAATMKLGYTMDAFGNLKSSVNIGKRPSGVINDVRSETFNYDKLHRMTSAQRNGQTAVTYSYTAVGNLLSKSDFGSNYQYTDAAHKHAVKQVTLATGGTKNYSYDANGNVIARGNNNSLTESFGFDIDNRPQYTLTNGTGTDARINTRIDFYLSATGAKALQVAAGQQTRTVIYAESYEAEYTGSTLTASRTYLAEGVLHNGAGTQIGLSFMHQDRLGSALVIADKSGVILNSDGAQAEFRSFDAFGKARDNQGLDSQNGRLFANNPNGKRNRKGFTGHEHLDEAGLIHMNGRAYDYNLGRFYGVDPIIQFPTNSQSLNGYSYLMNNPLSGTDPTGYCQKTTGSHLCASDGLTKEGRALVGAISSTLGAGGKVIFSGFNASERKQITAAFSNSGFKVTQGSSQTSQTDGSRGGASSVGAASSYDAAMQSEVNSSPQIADMSGLQTPATKTLGDGTKTARAGTIPQSGTSISQSILEGLLKRLIPVAWVVSSGGMSDQQHLRTFIVESDDGGMRTVFAQSEAEISLAAGERVVDLLKGGGSPSNMKQHSDSAESGILYHYTDAAGAKEIKESGTILPDARGRVFLTESRLTPEEVTNKLFIGNSGAKGSYVIEVNIRPGSAVRQGKNELELIHQGAIRDGRQADIKVKLNDF